MGRVKPLDPSISIPMEERLTPIEHRYVVERGSKGGGGKPPIPTLVREHKDYVYQPRGRKSGKIFDPIEICNFGCLNPFMRKSIETCTPFTGISEFSKLCLPECEQTILGIHHFIPTETDHPGLYYIVGAGIGKKLLEKSGSDFHFNQCPSFSLLPEHAMFPTSEQEALVKIGENMAAAAAVAALTLSLLAFGKGALVQKVRGVGHLLQLIS